MNLALARGATVVTMRRFELDAFLAAVERHRVTRAFLVPPILLALAKHPPSITYDMSSLRVIVSGAAPLDADLARACGARLGCDVYQGYGLTEASPVTHLPPDGARGSRAPGSVGPALPGTECRTVDPVTRLPLPDGRRRDRDSRPAGDAGLPARPRGDRGCNRCRRVAVHGRPRPHRCRRPAVPRRPAQGADQGAAGSRWPRRSSRRCSCRIPPSPTRPSSR